MLLKDMVVVITGGAGLLGARFCLTVAEQGGIVVVADRDFVAAKRVSDEINVRDNFHAEAILLDITKKNSIQELIGILQQRHGRIDAVVNNAYPRNQNYGRKFEDVSYDDFCENLNLHLGGYFLISQQFAMFFRKQGEGNIINIASIYGVVAPSFEIYQDTSMTMPVEYAVIKSSLIHLTKYMANYLKGTNIRVNAISPGGIKDNQSDLFLEKYATRCLSIGVLEAKDICGTLVYLLSDLSHYVNGQNIIVDDGFCL